MPTTVLQGGFLEIGQNMGRGHDTPRPVFWPRAAWKVVCKKNILSTWYVIKQTKKYLTKGRGRLHHRLLCGEAPPRATVLLQDLPHHWSPAYPAICSLTVPLCTLAMHQAPCWMPATQVNETLRRAPHGGFERIRPRERQDPPRPPTSKGV